jgi:hypothetical protein
VGNTGRSEEALSECRRTLEIDPLWARGHQAMQFALLWAGGTANPLFTAKEALELEPDFMLAWICPAIAYIETASYEEAEKACEAIRRRSPGNSLTACLLVWCFTASGRTTEARQVVGEFLTGGGERARAGRGGGDVWNARGTWFGVSMSGSAAEGHDELLACLPTWTAWDPLRRDPRCEVLLRRLNFPESSLDAHRARLRGWRRPAPVARSHGKGQVVRGTVVRVP